MSRTPIELLVTLWPAYAHFPQFTEDPRIAGIRLNPANAGGLTLEKAALEAELEKARPYQGKMPLYYDAKARQLRVMEVIPNRNYADIRLNHPISANLPVEVLLKAGEDQGLVGRISEGGRRLTFAGNPSYQIRPGESLHILDPSLRSTIRDIFTIAEKEKLQVARAAGFTRYFLSYVEQSSDIDQFQEIVGPDAEIMLKIESLKGLEFAARHFRKRDNLTLVAACGDLYVEVRPRGSAFILQALKTILAADSQAVVGSRLMLSVSHHLVADFCDYAQIAWLHALGYRRFMLCDDLCLKGELLEKGVSSFDAYRQMYPQPMLRPAEEAPRAAPPLILVSPRDPPPAKAVQPESGKVQPESSGIVAGLRRFFGGS